MYAFGYTGADRGRHAARTAFTMRSWRDSMLVMIAFTLSFALDGSRTTDWRRDQRRGPSV